jgi:hypothetical protein
VPCSRERQRCDALTRKVKQKDETFTNKNKIEQRRKFRKQKKQQKHEFFFNDGFHHKRICDCAESRSWAACRCLALPENVRLRVLIEVLTAFATNLQDGYKRLLRFDLLADQLAAQQPASAHPILVQFEYEGFIWNATIRQTVAFNWRQRRWQYMIHLQLPLVPTMARNWPPARMRRPSLLARRAVSSNTQRHESLIQPSARFWRAATMLSSAPLSPLTFRTAACSKCRSSMARTSALLA